MKLLQLAPNGVSSVFNYMTCSCPFVLARLQCYLLYSSYYSTTVPRHPPRVFLASCISIPIVPPLWHWDIDNSHELLDRAGLTRSPEINQWINFPIYCNLVIISPGLLSPNRSTSPLVSSSPATNRPAANKASHSLTSTPTVCLSLLPSAPQLGNPSLLTKPIRRKILQHSSREAAIESLISPLQPSLQPTDFTCVSPPRCAECDKFRKSTPNTNSVICTCQDRMDGAPLS